MTTWFDEIDLDPESTWRRMGTRALGSRPWLVADERMEEELALRRELFQRSADDVFVPAPRHVGDEVLHLIRNETDRQAGHDDPLAAAGLSVQEDLCLLQQRGTAWYLDAAFVCFPSRWRLADKIGRPLVEVHAPTDGYVDHLAPRVDRLLGHLSGRPVLRRNWFVHPDPSLHQPSAPVSDPVVPAVRALEGLHLRSERQTLRRLDCGWVLFTIRIQHDPLSTLLSTTERHHRFARYVARAPASDLAHRGIGSEQLVELRAALGITAAGEKSDTTSDL